MARTKSTALSGDLMTPEQEREYQAQAGAYLAALPDLPEPEPEPREPDPDDVALDSIIAELDGDTTGATVNVYRLGVKGEREFVGQFAPSEYSLPMLQAQFGGGKYRIEVRQNNRWLAKRTIDIATPKIPTLSPFGMVSPVPAAPDTGKLIEAMQSGFAQMGQMFVQALGQLAHPPAQKSTQEMLQEMVMMKELLGVGATPAQSPLEVLALAKDLAGLITPREGEPGAGEIMMNAIEKLGPLVGQVMSRQPVPQSIPQIPPVQQSPAPAPAPQPEQPTQPTEGDDMNLMQKAYFSMLLGAAKTEADPFTYANMALDMQGEDAVAFANNPQWFDMLCQSAPAAKEYRPWFTRMRDAIIELTTDETPDKTDSITTA